MLWDINTKFLPVEDLNWRQLFTKFEDSRCTQIWISCQNVLKLKRAWRAQFLSNAFQILQKCITFEDAQMILLSLLKILALNRIYKKSIQLLVHLCTKSTDIPILVVKFWIECTKMTKYFRLHTIMKWSCREMTQG